MTDREISDTLFVAVFAIQTMREEFRFKAKGNTVKTWSRDEREQLIAMCGKGLLNRDIAKVLGRTTQSIKSQRRDLRSMDLLPR